jgi:hypothetical protein
LHAVVTFSFEVTIASKITRFASRTVSITTQQHRQQQEEALKAQFVYFSSTCATV